MDFVIITELLVSKVFFSFLKRAFNEENYFVLVKYKFALSPSRAVSYQAIALPTMQCCRKLNCAGDMIGASSLERDFVNELDDFPTDGNERDNFPPLNDLDNFPPLNDLDKFPAISLQKDAGSGVIRRFSRHSWQT